jgi:hypothetical protein
VARDKTDSARLGLTRNKQGWTRVLCGISGLGRHEGTRVPAKAELVDCCLFREKAMHLVYKLYMKERVLWHATMITHRSFAPAIPMLGQ